MRTDMQPEKAKLSARHTKAASSSSKSAILVEASRSATLAMVTHLDLQDCRRALSPSRETSNGNRAQIPEHDSLHDSEFRNEKVLPDPSLSSPKPDHIHIAVIDDHPLYRDGVVQTLRGVSRFEVVAEGASREDAVRIAQEQMPDLMLLDINIPGNGIEAAKDIARLCPVVKILILTASDSQDDVFSGLEAGARGYILKGIGGADLAKMITSVYSGETIITPGLAGQILSRMNRAPVADLHAPVPSELTKREDEILALVAAGSTNKEVAIVLKISEKTVKHYMTNIMQKLHVRNRVEAAMARRPAAMGLTGK
jgi:two-component system, NarL family, nitrate/nitrite response regulator NarL